MRAQKRINFERANPGAEFPLVTSIAADKTNQLRGRIAHAVGLDEKINGLALVNRIADVQKRVPDVNADSMDFDLAKLVQQLGINPAGDIYLNWYRFDEIDMISLGKVSAYWSDIWYPAADDVDVFDDSCTWILSVSHAGDVSYVRLPIASKDADE